MCGQHGTGPGVGRILSAALRRRGLPDGLEVMAIASVDHELAQRVFIGTGHRQQGQIGMTVGQHLLGGLPIAGIDRLGQTADAAVGAEPVAVAQHRDGLVQRGSVGIDQGDADRLASGRVQPVAGGRGVVRLRRAPAQFTQHRTGFHRGELVAVAQQNQACLPRQGAQHRRHHLEVDHRGFIDDQHIECQRVAGVMAQAPGVGTTAQQAVQGGDLRWDCCADRGAIGQAIEGQPIECLGNRPVEPCGGLAGGGRQPDPQRLGRFARIRGPIQRQCLQQGQQPHHGARLAGTRSAGEDADRAAGGQRTGDLLPVGRHLRAGAGRKQDVENRPQGCRRGLGCRRTQAFLDCLAHRLFIVPVTAQIQTHTDSDQRGVARAAAHQFGPLEHRLPVGQCDPLEHLGGQWHRVERICRTRPFRGQRQRGARIVQRGRQVQTGVSAPQLMTGQCRGQNQQRRCLRHLFPEKLGEGGVERTQPFPAGPGGQQLLHWRLRGQEVGGAVHEPGGAVREPGGAVHEPRPLCVWLPVKRASSDAISARGGRSA